MELERQTLSHLVEYLKTHGYPATSLMVEFAVGKYRVDLAVVDPETSEIIQIFEIKSQASEQMRRIGQSQLQKYLKELRDPNIPSYLVFPSTKEPFFTIEKVSEVGEARDQKFVEADQRSMQFDYTLQKERGVAKKIIDTKHEREGTVDVFRWICWALATLLAALLVLLKTNVLKLQLDAADKGMIAAIVALILIPYASKLKILGVEFERLQKSREKK
jgi:hypothetical protein